MKNNIIIGLSLLAIICSCTKKDLTTLYNIGLINKTDKTLNEVVCTLKPEGLVEERNISPPNHDGWIRLVTKWAVPEEVIVSFSDTGNNHHTLKIPTKLPKTFSGDILIIILKNDNRYYLEIQTGKLDTLTTTAQPPPDDKAK